VLNDLKSLLRLLSRHKIPLAFSVLLGSVAGGATGFFLSNSLERLFGMLLDGPRDLSADRVLLVASSFPIIFLVIGLCLFFSGYLLNRSGLDAIRALRAKVFARVQALPLAYFQSSKSGDLISRITVDPLALQHTLTYIARSIIAQPATVIGASYYLYKVARENEGVLQIYLCLVALPIVIFPIRQFTRKIQQRARQQQDELGKLTDDLAQNLGAAREVRAFNLQGRENRRFVERLARLFSVQKKVVKYQIGLGPLVEFLSSFGLPIAFVIGYYNDVPSRVFASIFVALYLTYTAVKKLGTFAGELSKGMASFHRIEEVLDFPADIADPARPQALATCEGQIAFREVTFAYTDAPALRSVSVTIDAGETCALVGPSGAGKSTFANLLLRFYDVSSGSILVDGKDIRSLRVAELRDRISLVSQEPVLFDDSILENIRLGRQDASDEAVREAARLAYAHDFIADPKVCPDGYDTLVGERGARLSGGQRQRIAIARAFLRRAPIIILDEATSALDSESESKVQSALEKLVAGKTVLLIAHRFSTIKVASRILVFEAGKIVDSGSHHELYDRCGLYRSLFDQQR